MKILFKNANILDLDKPSGFIHGEVLVEDDIIKYVGEKSKVNDVDRIIDVDNNILMPGFVDAHAHTAMTLLRGVKDDADLQDWLFNNIFPLEAKLTKEDIYWGAKLGICEYLRAGITTIEDFYIYGSMKAFQESKIRARISVLFSEIKKEERESYIKNELREFDNKLLKPVLTAHSIYVTNTEDLDDIIKYSKQFNLPVSIHLSETLKEVGDCSVKNKDMTPPEFLEYLGFLDRKCLAYHCVHMDKDDLKILANNDVSVATCPSSNIKLASGIAPIYAMQNQNINICIGTDGVASNNSLDMFKEMFLVSTLSKVNIYNPTVVKIKDVIKMATINGAKALGFENLGEIKENYLADIILINTKLPHWQPKNNMLSHLVYSAKSSDVYLTMVDGNILYENDIKTLNENEIIDKVNQIYERINKNGNN